MQKAPVILLEMCATEITSDASFSLTNSSYSTMLLLQWVYNKSWKQPKSPKVVNKLCIQHAFMQALNAL